MSRSPTRSGTRRTPSSAGASQAGRSGTGPSSARRRGAATATTPSGSSPTARRSTERRRRPSSRRPARTRSISERGSRCCSRMSTDAPRPLPPEELGFERIVYTKEPPRATIRLNRPEVLNAFDFRMLREIARAAEDASWDDEVRVVVVTGTGRAFCVGADLRSFGEELVGRPGEYWKWFGAFKDMHDRLRELGKPTVARVQGIAVGGGRAREVLLLCEEIPARTAAAWGLVNWAVPAAELDAKVDEVVAKLAAKLPQTVRYTKQQLNWWRDLAWHETV